MPLWINISYYAKLAIHIITFNPSTINFKFNMYVKFQNPKNLYISTVIYIKIFEFFQF